MCFLPPSLPERRESTRRRASNSPVFAGRDLQRLPGAVLLGLERTESPLKGLQASHRVPAVVEAADRVGQRTELLRERTDRRRVHVGDVRRRAKRAQLGELRRQDRDPTTYIGEAARWRAWRNGLVGPQAGQLANPAPPA